MDDDRFLMPYYFYKQFRYCHGRIPHTLEWWLSIYEPWKQCFSDCKYTQKYAHHLKSIYIRIIANKILFTLLDIDDRKLTQEMENYNRRPQRYH